MRSDLLVGQQSRVDLFKAKVEGVTTLETNRMILRSRSSSGAVGARLKEDLRGWMGSCSVCLLRVYEEQRCDVYKLASSMIRETIPGAFVS